MNHSEVERRYLGNEFTRGWECGWVSMSHGGGEITVSFSDLFDDDFNYSRANVNSVRVAINIVKDLASDPSYKRFSTMHTMFVRADELITYLNKWIGKRKSDGVWYKTMPVFSNIDDPDSVASYQHPHVIIHNSEQVIDVNKYLLDSLVLTGDRGADDPKVVEFVTKWNGKVPAIYCMDRAAYGPAGIRLSELNDDGYV